MFGLIIWIIIISVILWASFIRKVPPNTVIIIDRNSHYHKTKKRGYYFFNSKTDQITTKISTNPIRETYGNIFKTHDDKYYELNYSFEYKATEGIDKVLSSLQDSRRSIYDVVNCAVETVVLTFSQKDVTQGAFKNNETFFKQLETMLEPFYIDATSFRAHFYREVPEAYGTLHKFTKHVPSSNGIISGSDSIGDAFDSIGIDGDDPFAKL